MSVASSLAPSARWFGLVCALTAAVAACKRDAPSAKATESASAAAPSAPGVDAAPSVGAAPATAAPVIVRAKLSDTPPAEKPPSTARVSALGVAFETVASGDGAEVGRGADVLAELKVWDAANRVVTDTTKQPKPFAFGVEGLPGELGEELARQRVGALLRVWLPSEATSQVRLAEWPTGSNLRLELKILGLRPRPAPTERALGGPAVPKRFDPPAASGPPASAKASPEGIRHIWLESGPEGRQATAADTLQLRLNGYSVAGLVVSTVVSDQPTSLAFASAPAALKPILGKMVPGDTVRAWLPPVHARLVLPQADAAAVVDVTLVGFQ